MKKLVTLILIVFAASLAHADLKTITDGTEYTGDKSHPTGTYYFGRAQDNDEDLESRKANRADTYTKAETDTSLGAKADTADLSTITAGTDPTKAAVAELADSATIAETARELDSDFVDGEARVEFGDNTSRTPEVGENSIYIEAGVLKKSIGGVESDLLSGGSSTVENTAYAPDWEGDLNGTSKDTLFDKFTSLSSQFSALQTAVAAFTSASDTTAPVVALGSDDTHDGTGIFTVTADMVTEINLISVTVQIDGGSVGTVTLPYDVTLSGTSDLTVNVVATDIAGNTGVDSILLVYSAPVVYKDAFDRPNAESLGDNWSSPTVLTMAQIESETVYAKSLQRHAYWSANILDNDQYAQQRCVYTRYGGPAVRMSNTADIESCYYIKAHATLGFGIFKVVEGVETELQPYATDLITDGTSIIKLTATGTTLTAYVNGVPLSPTVTDGTFTSGYAGMRLGPNTQTDDWEGGNL